MYKIELRFGEVSEKIFEKALSNMITSYFSMKNIEKKDSFIVGMTMTINDDDLLSIIKKRVDKMGYFSDDDKIYCEYILDSDTFFNMFNIFASEQPNSNGNNEIIMTIFSFKEQTNMLIKKINEIDKYNLDILD